MGNPWEWGRCGAAHRYVNDPDMMIAGMPGLSAAQNRTHLNLGAVSGGRCSSAPICPHWTR
ncbi:hypothetical protein [Dactylosporangium sp. CA-233914]|uniref:hypothetical protein n=1 Tax=Dactylosporangium sp. CA-233914 TaxID=3239934 RepID=UPI003D8AD2E3